MTETAAVDAAIAGAEAEFERDAPSKPNFHGHIKSVTAPGFSEAPEWSRREDALHVETKLIRSDAPAVFKIEVE